MAPLWLLVLVCLLAEHLLVPGVEYPQVGLQERVPLSVFQNNNEWSLNDFKILQLINDQMIAEENLFF